MFRTSGIEFSAAQVMIAMAMAILEDTHRLCDCHQWRASAWNQATSLIRCSFYK